MAHGDFDGDGIEDLATGQPARDAAGRVVLTSEATEAAIRGIFGAGAPEVGDAFGKSVVTIEDLDRDGISDIIVSAPGSISAARVDAYSGATGQRVWTRPSLGQGLAFGWSLELIDDLDGDGKKDILIGSPTLCMGLPAQCGLTTATPNGQVLVASGAVANIGSGLSPIGIVDPVVPFIPLASVSLGQADVIAIWCSTGAEIWRTTNPSGTTSFGTSIAMLPDRNGDGRPEIVVGAPNAHVPGEGFNGSMKILSGSTGQVLSTVATGLPNEILGVRVSSLGDQDGDLIPEYAGLTNMVDPEFAPPELLPVRDRLRVFSGSQNDLIDVRSSAPYVQSMDSDGFGYAMAPIADLNGDGFGELVIGAPNALAPAGLVRQGFVDILSVRPSPMVTQQGSGCSLTENGQIYAPIIGTTGGTPAVQTGNPNFAITLQGAPPNASAALFYGPPASSWNGLPLPLDLTPFGLPGCVAELALGTYVPISLAGSTPPGSALISAPIPQNPSLSGIEVLTQWAVQSTTSVTPAIALTSALKITLK